MIAVTGLSGRDGLTTFLATACLIDEPDDLLNLITIAKKMGFNPSDRKR